MSEAHVNPPSTQIGHDEARSNVALAIEIGGRAWRHAVGLDSWMRDYHRRLSPSPPRQEGASA